MRRLLTFALAVSALVTASAQNRMSFSVVSSDSGHVALGLAIRKLNVSGTFMQSAAHPDDEHNALFALYTRGMGLRSIDLQTNRGEGGQNEIGPELFRDIGVLRTSELLSAHRIDGAEQYFTRALDYGYSFSPEEVIDKWGRDVIVGDFVRQIRTFRPDVFLTMNIQGRGGDRAHEATTILAREAWKVSGDPNAYPEQIEEGLRPWQPPKLYFTGGRGVIPSSFNPGATARPTAPQPPPASAQTADTSRLCRVNTGAYDELLGRTYTDIGTDAHSNHKCQGTGGLPAIPGVQVGARGRGGQAIMTYQLVATTIPGQMEKDETSLFDGIDTSLAGIARFAGQNPPQALTAGLNAIVQQAELAQKAFASGSDAATAAPIGAGLTAVRSLLSQLGSMGLSDSAKYELEFRLKQKERDYQDAVVAAHGLKFEAIADDGLIVAGQPIKLSLVALNRGATDVDVTGVAVAGLSGAACAAGPAKAGAVYSCSVDASVPADAKLTQPYFHDNYWKHPGNPAREDFDPGVPFGIAFAPSPFHVTYRVKAGAVDITEDQPIQFRYVKDVYEGDKRMELTVVPAFSVRMTPGLAVIPAPRAGESQPLDREIHVTVTNGTKASARAIVTLNAPAGWKVTPANAQVDFEHEDEALSARFRVTAPANVAVGEYPVRAIVTSSVTGDQKFVNGYQEIEYPHVERRQVIKAAQTSVKVVDVKTTPGITVGYIVGVGDQVPPAIEQLGAKVEFIDADELAWGNLSKYDVIMTGVRAYERRDDLRAYNRRLLDYVERGGTVLVQYNKMEFNQQQYGPWPAKVSTNRVSDEDVPVQVLQKEDPVFTRPNRVTAQTWKGWVQERGLYFLGDKDPKYTDLVSMVDSFPDNPGTKLGALVEAKYGKGRWIYIGLGLWRQLPAGTDGAYQLLANMISLSKTPSVPAVK
ncbi:MAG TPA: PIG-L family deacetylase [Vicinamibacterales bacterium]|nr:PIG-L family deacetylase [Vicinamibacterales bacterium]